jgi:hypothetical protein
MGYDPSHRSGCHCGADSGWRGHSEPAPAMNCVASWYQMIEPGIRRHVRLLRDNGFNTYSSCEHRMEVALDLSPQEDLACLDDLLSRSGFRDYTILVRVKRRQGFLRSGAVVQFGDDRLRHRIARRYRSLAAWWEPPGDG